MYREYTAQRVQISQEMFEWYYLRAPPVIVWAALESEQSYLILIRYGNRTVYSYDGAIYKGVDAPDIMLGMSKNATICIVRVV